jgi:tetratricopeptide (TPR) repeat protein
MSAHMHAEDAYLFRHALVRDAAYELQPPSDRARLHALAFELVESLFGGPAPDPGSPDFGALQPPPAHATDAVVQDLALHAELATGAHPRFAQAAARYLYRAAKQAHTSFRYREAHELWRRLASRLSGKAALVASYRQGEAALEGGLTDQAAELFSRVLHRASADANAHAEGLALAELAAAKAAQGEPTEAEQDARRAVMLLRAGKDSRALAKALSRLGGVLGRSGAGDEALACYQEAYDLLTAIGEFDASAAMLNNLAGLFNSRGEVQHAEQLYQRAYQLHHEHGRPHSTVAVLINLGGLYGRTAREELALQNFQAALEIAREVGNRKLEAGALGSLAAALTNLYRESEAEPLCLQAIDISRECGDVWCEASTLTVLMSIYIRTKRYTSARETGERALTLSRRLGVRSIESLVLYTLASMAVDLKQPAEACQLFEQAIEIQRAARLRHRLGGTLCNYMHALLHAGRVDDARRAWLEGSQLLRETGDLPSLEFKTGVMRALCAEAGIEPFPVAPTAGD